MIMSAWPVIAAGQHMHVVFVGRYSVPAHPGAWGARPLAHAARSKANLCAGLCFAPPGPKLDRARAILPTGAPTASGSNTPTPGAAPHHHLTHDGGMRARRPTGCAASAIRRKNSDFRLSRFRPVVATAGGPDRAKTRCCSSAAHVLATNAAHGMKWNCVMIDGGANTNTSPSNTQILCDQAALPNGQHVHKHEALPSSAGLPGAKCGRVNRSRHQILHLGTQGGQNINANPPARVAKVSDTPMASAPCWASSSAGAEPIAATAEDAPFASAAREKPADMVQTHQHAFLPLDRLAAKAVVGALNRKNSSRFSGRL